MRYQAGLRATRYILLTLVLRNTFLPNAIFLHQLPQVGAYAARRGLCGDLVLIRLIRALRLASANG